jgi:hypothetical protein
MDKKPFDRAAHCQRIGHRGGMTTVERYGIGHMRTIGKTGRAITVERHGEGYWRGLRSVKRWRKTGPRRPDFSRDMQAGQLLAYAAD